MKQGERRAMTAAVMLLAAAAAVAGFASCNATGGDEVPRQGWNERKWGPLVPHQTFPGDCALCHVPDTWSKIRSDFTFDHEKQTGFALEGAHADAKCLRCHNDRGPVTAYLARGCSGCHVDPHEAQLGVDCTRCHDQASWRPTGIVAEHMRTRFPLTGPHLAVTCDRCHPGAHVGRFEGASTLCEDCHASAALASKTVDHQALGYTRDCQRCHVPATWKRTHFAHTQFPLTGGHRVAACAACHKNNQFVGLPTDCVACHLDDYNNASDPPHAAGGFSTQCQTCHTTNPGWSPALFDHTIFPLTGAHRTAKCASCHKNGQYQGLPTDCFGCHSNDYNGATKPPHAAEVYPTSCEFCHSTNPGWAPPLWNHETYFPIDSGKHSSVKCIDCHTSTNYPVFDCIDCHTHNKTDTDNKHQGVKGYQYDSPHCYACHPRGNGG
jgi:hypothetical protein